MTRTPSGQLPCRSPPAIEVASEPIPRQPSTQRPPPVEAATPPLRIDSPGKASSAASDPLELPRNLVCAWGPPFAALSWLIYARSAFRAIGKESTPFKSRRTLSSQWQEERALGNSANSPPFA